MTLHTFNDQRKINEKRVVVNQTGYVSPLLTGMTMMGLSRPLLLFLDVEFIGEWSV